MKEINTSETNAAWSHDGNWDTKALRMRALAERLERQRNDVLSDTTYYIRKEAVEKLELQVSELMRERDELQAWKDSAIAVECEWDPMALATMLGGRIGESSRQIIQREVPKLLERIEQLEKELGNVRGGVF